MWLTRAFWWTWDMATQATVDVLQAIAAMCWVVLA